MRPCVWTIGGSDSSGGAGIQADLHTIEHLGAHGASVVTAVTSQTAETISNIYYVPPNHIDAQLSALKNTMRAAAIKIGMLGHIDTIECIANFLQQVDCKIILDPLLFSSSKRALFSGDIKLYSQTLISLFHQVNLLTPNIHEAELLTGMVIKNHQDMQTAAHVLLSLGIESVLIKGGHFLNDDFSQDYWTNGKESFWMASHRYPEKNYRGTGCVFSSAVAASIALGYEIKDALVIAKMYVNQGIRLSELIDANAALMTHQSWPEAEIDLPYLSDYPLQALPSSFPDCGETKLGLYPVVNNADWLEKLLSLGVKSIQLRMKETTIERVEETIKIGISLAKKHHARLFINDYWALAIKHGAYGVHLGQEDLTLADVDKIHQAGLRLGISTHCYYEVARAHRYKPSYIACGPIFHTTSKIMPFSPQGISNLARWHRTLRHYPLVAIGGIGEGNVADVLATGVSGVAMISAITHASDPIAITKKLLMLVENNECQPCL